MVEWLVTVQEDSGYMRRFIFHHQADDFAGVASRAVQLAVNTYAGGDFNAPGHWVHIISIVNREAV